MAYKMLHFRNTLLGGTGMSSLNGGVNNGDGDDGVAFSAADSPYPTTRNGVTFGIVGSTPFSANTSNPTDANFSGYVRAFLATGTFGFQYKTRIDLVNGYYTFKASIAGGANCGYTFWDGAAPTPQPIKYAGNKVFTAGQSIIVNGHFYTTAAGGTSDVAGVPPSHTNGDAVDGTVTWTYQRSALLWIHGGASGAHVDATNVDRTTIAGWLANNQPSGPKQVTQGYITGIRTSDSADNTILETFGFQTYSAPLVDVSLNDVYNAPVAGQLVINAEQPAGVPLARIMSTNGVQNYSIDPTSDLYGYVAVQEYPAGSASTPGFYLVSTALPITDAMAGDKTIKLTQTDPNVAPHTTIFTTTVVSSGGRNTSTGILALISTEAWKIYSIVDGVFAARWQGHTNQAFAQIIDVISATDFQTKWNALVPVADNWYKFRFQNGTYETSRYLDPKDFGRNGGVVLEPYPGHDPAINAAIRFGGVSGIHIRGGLRFPGIVSKMGGTLTSLEFNDRGNGSTYWNRIKIDGSCKFGTMFETGHLESDIMLDTLSPTAGAYADYKGGDTSSILVHQAESFEITDCDFDGTGAAIYSFGARALFVHKNRAMRCANDFLGWSPMEDYDSTLNATAFGDNNLYVYIRDNVYHREIDYAGHTNGKHGDFRQVRKLGTVTWSAGQAVTAGNKRLKAGKIYQCTTGGNCGSTGPNGNVGDVNIADGTAVWSCIAALPPLVVNEVFMGNTLLSTGILTSNGTGDRQLYFANLDETLFTINAMIVDNAEGACTVYGVAPAHNGKVYAEFNTLTGPHAMNPSLNMLQPQLQSQGSMAKVLGRNNIVAKALAGVDGVLQRFGGAVADYTTTAGANPPGNVMQGAFTNDGNNHWKWNNAFVDGPAVSADAVKLAMRKQFRPKAGVGAGCSLVLPVTVGPDDGFTGDPLSTTITILP